MSESVAFFSNYLRFLFFLSIFANEIDNKLSSTNLSPMKKIFIAFLALLVVACEKPYVEENEKTTSESVNVILRMTQFEQIAFTRTATDITDLCSRLNVAIFSSDGSKVQSVVQKAGDANFGTIALTIPAGTYKLVVIAHNGEGSATISSIEKVTFPSNKVTDTFYYYGDLVVNDAQQTYDLALTRAVAMFRLVLTDETIPSNVAKMKFYYTGGSSTFSPVAGYGCVASKQTEIRTVEDGITQFDIYTMPHSEDDVLTKLTISALDANENVVKEQSFENIPITRNLITRYNGNFFGGGGGNAPESGSAFRMTANPDWDNEKDYEF